MPAHYTASHCSSSLTLAERSQSQPSSALSLPTQTQTLCTTACTSLAPRVRRQWTLARPHESLLEAKGSKFFAHAWPVATPEQALARVAARSDPKASHNCFAYRIGEQFRSTDDGEPSGTAGRPMLAAIDGEALDGVCVLVVRHFGGTKLGAGGLVRAYGGAARECLQEAERVFVPSKVRSTLATASC